MSVSGLSVPITERKLMGSDIKSFLTLYQRVVFLSLMSHRLCNMMQTEEHCQKAHSDQNNWE